MFYLMEVFVFFNIIENLFCGAKKKEKLHQNNIQIIVFIEFFLF